MHKLVAIAGTFDRLHTGHRFFISEAFRLGERVLIGLTSDEFARKKLSVKTESGNDCSEVEEFVKPKIEGFEKRRKELENFLKEKDFLHRVEIVKIEDVYGPAIDPPAGEAGNNEIEALVVTGDTLEGGRKVNRKRRSLGFPPLKLIKIHQVLAEDHRRIASTRIRLGEIDRYGKVYLSKIKDPWPGRQGRQRSKIKDGVRQRLKKPLGLLIKGDSGNPHDIAPEITKIVKEKSPVLLITVGDVATKMCNEIGISPNLAVIDFKVGRIKKYNSLSDLGFTIGLRVGPFQGPTLIKARNPAGYITASVVSAVKKAMKNLVTTGKQQIIKVIGEEDLAGVPAILLTPLGSLILYGQPGEGIVAVDVTEEKKNDLLKKINN